MGSSSGAHSTPQVALAQSGPTLQSGSCRSTPGTSAPWGTDRVVTPSPQPGPRPRSGALRGVAGAALVGLAALAGFLFLGRGPASVESARPEAPIAVVPSLPPAAAAAPSAALAPNRPADGPVRALEPRPRSGAGGDAVGLRVRRAAKRSLAGGQRRRRAQAQGRRGPAAADGQDGRDRRRHSDDSLASRGANR